jgi:hypothetical protein
MFRPDRRCVLGSLATAAVTGLVPAAARGALETLDPAAMRGDVTILSDAYSSLHPGLYRYLTPAQFVAARERLDLAVAKPLSRGDFYLALSCVYRAYPVRAQLSQPGEPDADNHRAFR